MVKKIFYILLLGPVLLIAQPVHVLDDAAIVAHIRRGMDYTYNFEFQKAVFEYEYIHARYPTHPAYNFLMGLNMYWDILCNDSGKKNAATLKKYLDKSLALSIAITDKYPNDPEGVFFKLSSEAYQVLFYAENDMNSEAFSASRKAYYTLKKGKELKDKLVEFYFPSGMYDYFIVQYPQNKPAFKPFTIFFMSGDKERGLKDLDYTFNHAIFTRMECGYHLCNIYLKYEDKPASAYEYSKLLVQKFPGNYYYLIRHIEALIARSQYDDAEKYIRILMNSGKPFFLATGKVFEGLIAEKHVKDKVLSKKKYNQAIELFKQTSNPENDYLSFAYAGLGRIAVSEKNKIESDKWYKLCNSIAEYTSVIRECREYFRK